MTLLPALEEALDEAAHRHYGTRRRRSLRPLLPVLAIAACAGVAVLALPGRTDRPVQEPQPPVPAATLSLSRALAQAPDLRDLRTSAPVIAHLDLPAVADAFEDATPYPPGRRDTFDWRSTAAGPRDMRSINFAREVRSLVEWRAACIWLRYWLDGDAAARQAANVVLGDVPSWPTLRGHPGNWADGVTQDAAALERNYQRDCAPWSNRQGG